MQITTEALVIRTMDIGESDRLLTLLTDGYGVIKAFAPSAKKIKSKHYSATSYLCYSHFSLEEVKGTYRVRDSVINRSFFKMGCDIKIISLQQYFCEVIAYLSPIDNESSDFLRLMLNSLYILNQGKINPEVVKAVFELKALSLAGFMPDLSACKSCGSSGQNGFYFNHLEGILQCYECVEQKGNCSMLDMTILSAMRFIVDSNFEKMFNFHIPDESAVRLSKITERYMISQTEHSFKTLDFYNTL